MSIRILSGVHRASVRVARFYEKKQPGLGAMFFDRFDAAVDKIERNPLGYPRLESTVTERDIRRIVLNQFPYLLIYENIGDETLVISLRHVSQNPSRHVPGGTEPKE